MATTARTTTVVGAAIGIDASSAYGDVTVSNASDITALSLYASATGINATALYDVAVTNSGDIEAASQYATATGINASCVLHLLGIWLPFDGTTTVSNSGNITLEAPEASTGQATGISATREIGDVVVGNSGDIEIYAGGRSYGIDAFTKYGDVVGHQQRRHHHGVAHRRGDRHPGLHRQLLRRRRRRVGDQQRQHLGAQRLRLRQRHRRGRGQREDPYGDSYIRNSGDIDVFGQYIAAGIQTRATDGNATVINSGDMNVATGAKLRLLRPGPGGRHRACSRSSAAT